MDCGYKFLCSIFNNRTQKFDFIKPNVNWKLTDKFKYISQINGGLIVRFDHDQDFLELVGSFVNNMERINTKIGTWSP